jgi:hypothetical protein
MIMFGYTVYTIDKFHIQWCLYPMMDLWNIINEWINKKKVNLWNKLYFMNKTEIMQHVLKMP